MYTPPYTRWENRDAAFALARHWNFGELITVVDGAPMVTHMPFLIDEKRNVLRAHLARANPHGGHIEGAQHLAVFKGPYAYISPDWYGKTHDDVPTWNYLAVHVMGKGRVVSDPAQVDVFLADLSAHEEHRRPDLDRGGVVWTIGKTDPKAVGSSRVDLQACKLEYSIVSPK